MSESKIEWTDETWNPITGCEPVSEGCDNCYAQRMAKRLKAMGQENYQNGPDGFEPTFHLDMLDRPLSWKKPKRVFVCSMSDIAWATGAQLVRIYARMAMLPHITFQLLTKRPSWIIETVEDKFDVEDEVPSFEDVVRATTDTLVELNKSRPWLDMDYDWPLKNVWVGVTAENQERADQRIPKLLDIPAAVRFVSCEPLLGALDLARSYPEEFTYCDGCGWHGDYFDYKCGICAGTSEDDRSNCIRCGTGTMDRACPACGQCTDVEHPHAFRPEYRPLPGIDWVITGGESGPGARPTHPDWVRDLRDQSQAADVPFFMKQITRDGQKVAFADWPTDLQIREFPGSRV